ncbi:MAG TPA: flagellar export chaperone FlgN [Synergistaceae bacterium]|nr:flagellar export chaperone FlgN [Synergistaceae bacterium]HPJ25458.1 flagellar export chaperone FlgN [Synergistaceae bacterium]HPQ36721.1 flagellar export chaperone FlgN [Synergistaceae bacterium]
MQAEFFQSLEELLQKERDLYLRLEKMVDEEEAFVGKEDWEGLLKVLQRKQTVIAEQEVLQNSWASFSSFLDVHEGRESAAFWDAVKKKVGESSYTYLTDLVEDLRSAVLQIVEREEHLRDQVEHHLGDLRKKMLQVQKGKAAYRGYAKAGNISTMK